MFTDYGNAGTHVGVLLAEGADVAILLVSARDILHRVFRGDRDGLVVVDPVSLGAVLAGEAERHEIASLPVTIGELLDEE